MDIIKENETQISVMFNSLVEVVEMECPSIIEKNREQFLYYSGRKRGDQKWFGPTCTTGKQIIENGLLGDKEIYEKYLKPKISLLGEKEEVKDSEQHIKVVKRKKIRGSFGDELDIHKVYQGQIETAWSRTKRIEVSQKFHLVTLLVDYVGSCNENAMDSLWRAAVVVRLANELERAGKSVQVLVSYQVTSSSPSHNKIVSSSVVIKKFNESLNLERLSALCHLGAFRTFGFMGLLCQDYPLNYFFGYPNSLSIESLPLHLKEDKDSGHTKFVIIGRASSLQEAKNELASAYKQMKDFAK